MRVKLEEVNVGLKDGSFFFLGSLEKLLNVGLGDDVFDGFLEEVLFEGEIDFGEFGVDVFEYGLHRHSVQIGALQQLVNHRSQLC